MKLPARILGILGLCSLGLASLAQAQTLTDLYNFQGAADGGNPFATLIRDNAGNFYGTTSTGGYYNPICSYPGCGVIYKLDTAGNETPLYTFAGTPDGQSPVAGVVVDPAGNFYGTTAYGGNNGYGTVYMLNAAGSEKILRSFTGGTDGGIPNGGLVRDKDGNLYGTTFTGGSGGLGTVFKLSAAGVFSTIFTFPDTAHGSHPNATLTLDTTGDIYGTTQYGGASNHGIVFSLEPGSGAETVLYSFSGMPDGAYPQAQLVFKGTDLYGTTTEGGASNNGTVFKLTSSGTETILHNFGGSPDGSYPTAGVVLDKAGNVYGTTFHGGGGGGAGTVYKIDPAGNETLLYSFQGSFDGQGPWAGLILNPTATAVYGTTELGGFNCCGDIYSVTLP
jgi:uncharacterized repeat protein (TIGR03803 family)